MTTEEFMTAIGFSEELKAAVEREEISDEEAERLPSSDEILSGRYEGNSPARVLALFVHYLAAHGKEKYLERGVTPGEWLNTMKDLTVWSGKLYLERGELGIRETHWLAHLVRAEIFRLGRLQFVPRISDGDRAFGGHFFPSGTPFCEVHIPAGEGLLPELVDSSFRRAEELFRPRYFSCDSWLLSPRLKEILNGGNILSFAARFTVTETDLSDRSGERYIFDRFLPDPSGYSPRNPFAGQVKERAVRGEFLGSARGYFAAGGREKFRT